MPKAARFLAAAGVATLLPVAFASDAHAATSVGIYALYNNSTGKCADLPNFGWNPADTPVTQYTCTLGSGDNQMWDMQQTRTVNGLALFQFVNVKSGYCLDLPDYGAVPAGTRLSTYACSTDPAADNQEWYLNDVTLDGGYEIINYQDNLCLDVAGLARFGTDRADDLPLTVYTCYTTADGYDDHIWRFLN